MQVSCPWFWELSKVVLGGSGALTGPGWFLHHGLAPTVFACSIRLALLMSHVVKCFLQ